MPEPSLFVPPSGATDIQRVALFSHVAGMGVAVAASLATFARSSAKGVPSHLVMGSGLALAAGAAFAGQCAYASFIYDDSARVAFETRLFLMAGAAGLVSAGVALVPGFAPKRGAWLRFVIPVLGVAGFALAGVGRLPSLAQHAMAIGVPGGLLVAIAGALHLFDNAAAKPVNPQERLGAGAGFALAVSGALVALAAGVAGTQGGADKGVLALSVAESAFALFILLGVLSVVGKPSDFRKKVAKASAPAVVPANVPAPGYVPPPPGSAFPPPPPGGAPRPPSAPLPPAPGGAPRQPGR